MTPFTSFARVALVFQQKTYISRPAFSLRVAAASLSAELSNATTRSEFLLANYPSSVRSASISLAPQQIKSTSRALKLLPSITADDKQYKANSVAGYSGTYTSLKVCPFLSRKAQMVKRAYFQLYLSVAAVSYMLEVAIPSLLSTLPRIFSSKRAAKVGVWGRKAAYFTIHPSAYLAMSMILLSSLLLSHCLSSTGQTQASSVASEYLRA